MVLAHPYVVAGVAVGVAAIALVLLPLPWIGIASYNVAVTTELSETCVLGVCDYGVVSVSPTVTGPATVIDLGGWLGTGLSVAGPCIDCQYKLTTAFSAGGPSASAEETKFVPDLFAIDQTDTLTQSFAYVGAGEFTVTATLYLDGAQVASGSGSVEVGQ